MTIGLYTVVVPRFNDEAVRQDWGLDGQLKFLHDRYLPLDLIVLARLDGVSTAVKHLKVGLETCRPSAVDGQVTPLNDAYGQLVVGTLYAWTHEHVHLSWLRSNMGVQFMGVVFGARYISTDLEQTLHILKVFWVRVV